MGKELFPALREIALRHVEDRLPVIIEGDFLNPECITIPAGDEIVLEVKWDEFLPSIIRSAVQLDHARTTSFSKYQACRRFG